MDRGSIVAALTLVAGACFYDQAPRDGDPSTQDASADTTAAASTTGAATTSGTTLAVTTSGATSGAVDPTTGPVPDDTTAAMDPSTTQPTPTTGEATTGDVGACSGMDPLACYQCCADAEPGSQVFLASLAECTCTPNDPCLASCSDTLCKGLNPGDACLSCVATMVDMACLDQANAACQASPECGLFTACIAASKCGP